MVVGTGSDCCSDPKPGPPDRGIYEYGSFEIEVEGYELELEDGSCDMVAALGEVHAG